MVWDGTKVIMFGGWINLNGDTTNDLWWYNPGTNTWTQRIAQGAPGSPSPRVGHAMAWDGTKVIMFGGDHETTKTNDLWWYDSGTNTWTEKIAQGTSGSPSPREPQTMVWDGAMVIMFGGLGYDNSYRNDVWWYGPGQNIWTEKIAQGAPGSPAARHRHTMVWTGTKVIMFGGYTMDGEKNDLWWYDPETSMRPPAQSISPNPADGATNVLTARLLGWAAADGAASYDVYFGTSNPPQYQINTTETIYNPGTLSYETSYYWRIDSRNEFGITTGHVWRFRTANGIRVWFEKIANGQPGLPPVRSGQAMVWDGTRVIMFGGYDSACYLKNDLWWYDPGTNTWTQKIAQGAPGSPPARSYHSMVWDPATSGMIMFGGWIDMAGHTTNDLWWYNPGTNTWTQKIAHGAPGSPSARETSMVWDGTRVIMFGGAGDYGSKNDLWWYAPGTNIWTEKIAQGTPGSPSVRYTHAMVWDGTRMIMFGGVGNLLLKNDLWWYNPGTNTWTENIPQGALGSPPARCYHSMVWDGTRVIMFGGHGDYYRYHTSNDLWQYVPATNEWTEKIPDGDPHSPLRRYEHSMVWDGTRVIMFGGCSGSNDLWWYDHAVTPPDQVISPTPVDGTTNVLITTQELSWAAAHGAASYDVYFGTSNPPPYQTETISTTYNLCTLAEGTTYYWRINSRNDVGVTTGTVWSFQTRAFDSLPDQVTLPNPENETDDVLITQQLGWAPASRAASYDVYFGTSNPPLYQTNTTLTTYNPGTLSHDTTYYWRIDSRNEFGITTGLVWMFLTTRQ
jgi:hypothetical protein